MPPAVFQNGSLNNDEHNLRAEEWAMELCMIDHYVDKRWSEQECLFNFGGTMMPGTPDGMFEDDLGCLVCVQVVRVPVLPSTSLNEMVSRIHDTVLTKVVKSKTWMKSTRILPDEFIIFCWLFPGLQAKDLAVALRKPRAMMKRLRKRGMPFSLKFAVAGDACPVPVAGMPFNLKFGALFPIGFALNGCFRKVAPIEDAELYAFSLADFESDDAAEEWDVFAFEFDEEEHLLIAGEDDTIDDNHVEAEAADAELIEQDLNDQNIRYAAEAAALCAAIAVALHFQGVLVQARARDPSGVRIEAWDPPTFDREAKGLPRIKADSPVGSPIQCPSPCGRECSCLFLPPWLPSSPLVACA